MSSEDEPGGSMGCDVCGLTVVAERSAAHRAWHDRQDERSERLLRLVDEVLTTIRETRPDGR